MKKTTPRLTPVQRAALTEAAAQYLGKLSGALAGVTIDALVAEPRQLAYEGDNQGRPIKLARAAGYTGFSSYYLTHAAYRALGMDIFRRCERCERGTYVKAEQVQTWRCTVCALQITRAELQLTDQQYPEMRDGRLAVLTKAPEMTGTPGADAGHCDQCGTLIVWDRSGRRVHDEYGEYWCSTTRRSAGRNPHGTSSVHVLAGR